MAGKQFRNRRLKRDHVALYGNVRMARGYCSECAGHAFVMDGKLQCCDKKYQHVALEYRRMSEPEQARKKPSEPAQAFILAEQEYCCIYCSRAFNNYSPKLKFKGKTCQQLLRVEWDHLVPFSYSQDNRAENFVAACQMCNGWKSDLMFRNLDDARIYLLGKWESALIKVDD